MAPQSETSILSKGVAVGQFLIGAGLIASPTLTAQVFGVDPRLMTPTSEWTVRWFGSRMVGTGWFLFTSLPGSESNRLLLKFTTATAVVDLVLVNGLSYAQGLVAERPVIMTSATAAGFLVASYLALTRQVLS